MCPVRMLKYYHKKVISYAYEKSTEVLEGSVSGQDVRRMAASTAFAAGTSIHDILKVASGKSVATFTCHYL